MTAVASALMDRIGPEPGAAVPKADRVRLAQAELWLLLGVKCDQWRKSMTGEDGGLPFEEWPADDPFRALAHTYGLDRADMSRLLDRVGGACEARAERAGYADHWDPLPADETPPRSPRRRARATRAAVRAL